MKRRLKEESVIFISVVKWLVLASATGVIVGFSTTVFVKALNAGWGFATHYPHFFLLLPAGLLLSSLVVKLLLPEAEGHGADWVIESLHKRAGRLKPVVVPVEFIATFLTVSSGGSAGKEGPSAQIGAGLASIFADSLRLNDTDRRKLVVCGISGGFASVFGTPLAGAIFGIEVLAAGSILYEVLLPSFVAGIVSHQVSSALGLTYFYHSLEFVPKFTELLFLKVVAAGVLFGLVSFFLVEVMGLGRKASSSLKYPMAVKAVAAGAVLVVLTFISSEDYLGLGIETMERALNGGAVPWYAFFMKSIYTSVTLGFGGSGGIGTPIFFVGSTSGSALSGLLGVDPAMLSAIGFVAVLAGSANTPIAASIMAVEMFGAGVAPYASVASVISFVVSGHRSVFPSQVIAVRKSSSIEVPIGEELEGVRPEYRGSERSLIGLVRRIFKR